MVTIFMSFDLYATKCRQLKYQNIKYLTCHFMNFQKKMIPKYKI